MNKFQFIQHKINFLPAFCHFYQVVSSSFFIGTLWPTPHSTYANTCNHVQSFFNFFSFPYFVFYFIGFCMSLLMC